MPVFMELDVLLVFGSPDVGVTDTNFGYNPHTQVNNPRIAQVSGRFFF
jgi:hypothetical protein